MKLPIFVAASLIALVIASSSQAQVSLCWGDVTLDRDVNTDDLLAVVTTWGPCVGAPPSNPGSVGPGGIDGDGNPTIVYCASDIAPPGAPNGIINTDDLLLVISGWGVCTAPPPTNGVGYVVFCEDWANSNFGRWTDDASDSDPCTTSMFTSERYVSPSQSFKSQVTCVGGTGGVHRGYAGLRFFGDAVLPSIHMTSTGGINSPYGFVATWRNYLHVPYIFNAQDLDLWMSMMTVTDDCSNAWHRVITLNIDDTSMRLRPQHVSGVQYAFGAPPFPRDQWNRITVYVNLTLGEMHVWQNGIKIAQAWFTRPSPQACQFHFGLYCSGQNDDITYYEDDFRIIKLTAPLANLIGEPTFPGMASNCLPVR